MIIRDLYVAAVLAVPNEADSILVIDFNRVIPSPIGSQRVQSQTVSRRHIRERLRRVKKCQPPTRYLMKI